MVVPGGVDRGGEERVIPALLWLIEGLAERHRVTVVALGQEERASRYPLLGATVLNVAAERAGPRQLVRQVARAVHAAGREGRPDVVHGLWASVSGLAAVLAARRHGVPSVVHAAGGELVSLPAIGYGGARGRGGRWIAAGALRGATAVTVASDWMAQHVRSCGYRVDAVIPLGVDTERFAPGPVAGRATDRAGCAAPYRLVSVADLNPVKDHDTMLGALAVLRERRIPVELDLIGTDTLHGRVARRAATAGGAVRCHGFVPSRALPALLRRADLHVIASRHDAGPVSVLEAAACGLATVGTRVGHVADLAAAHPPGAVAVPVGHPAKLGEAIAELLTDAPRRSAMAAVARRFALDHDRHATVDAFEALYARLAASSCSSAAAAWGSSPRRNT